MDRYLSEGGSKPLVHELCVTWHGMDYVPCCVWREMHCPWLFVVWGLRVQGWTVNNAGGRAQSCEEKCASVSLSFWLVCRPEISSSSLSSSSQTRTLVLRMKAAGGRILSKGPNNFSHTADDVRTLNIL